MDGGGEWMTGSLGIDGAQFVYEDHGPRVDRSLPPILLLHGAVQSRSIWKGQIASFARDRRVIVPDLRGHGETGGDVSDMSIERNADDMAALLDALHIDRAIICGVSLGGMVALEMASRAPKQVAGLILADTPLALSLDGFVRSVLERVGPQRILTPLFGLFGRRLTARMGLAGARAIFGKAWVGERAGRFFVDGFATMRPEAIVATYAAIVAADPVELRDAALPCLVIVGRHETRLVVAHAGEIARRLGAAEIVSVEGGHVPNVDAPDEFNKAVLVFVERFFPSD